LALSMKKWPLVLAVLFLVACASKDNQEVTTGTDEGEASSGYENSGVHSGSLRTRSYDSNELTDPQSILSKRSIYFGYDSFAVEPEFQPIIEAHAHYLMAHLDAKVILQGNTDDRGSREYNLALGARRAEAVKQAMVVLGVSATQIETVSFGKEKPKAHGADEASRAENRRVDIVYMSEAGCAPECLPNWH
jgi:peptidoglycan-associated lipoprotein